MFKFFILSLTLLASNLSLAAKLLIPKKITSIAKLDFGRNISAVKDGNKLKFSAKDSALGNTNIKSSGNNYTISVDHASGDGGIASFFSSSVDNDTQTVSRIYSHVYDHSVKPLRGSHGGHIWQFKNGKLNNYTRCSSVDFGNPGDLMPSSGSSKHCYTVTPSGCQEVLVKIGKLDSLESDLKACKNLSKRLSETLKLVEPKGIHEKNVSLLNKHSLKNKAFSGFDFNKYVEETMMNEFRTLDEVRKTCLKLAPLWQKDGQIEAASASYQEGTKGTVPK